ncbi:MAG: insulinase family protein, partial [Gammaproteobacteria bacterium]|nr:insulinase family protein [Gammaproteobacteria bacterium]
CSGFHFSTRYSTDFDNLLKVYLDALFFPQLDPLIFAREGVRIDFDADDKISFNGVVFNEMKGALNDTIERVKMTVRAQLFPNSRYVFNQGGEPLSMTELGIDHIRAFHQQFYRPTNANFVTYGDQPAQDHQQKFVSYALDRFQQNNSTKITLPESPRPEQSTPKNVIFVGDKATVSKEFIMTWRLGHALDTANHLRARLLQQLLVTTEDSAFQQALIEKGIKLIPGPLSGLNDECVDFVFSLRLLFTCPPDNESSHNVILETLSEITPDTFSQQDVENALDNIELDLTNLDSARESAGLILIRRMVPALLYDTGATHPLKISEHLSQLHKESKYPAFVPELIQEYLLDNKSRVCMNCASARENQLEEAIKLDQRLAEMWCDMDITEKTARQQTFKSLQQQNNVYTDTLPIFKIDQMQVPATSVKLEQCVAGTPSLYYSCALHSGVSHLSIAFGLSGLPAGQIQYLSVYVTWLQHNAKKLFTLNNAEFKLLVVSPELQVLLISGKCLSKHTQTLLEQVLGLLFNTNSSPFNSSQTLVSDTLQRMESNLNKYGHEFAMRLAASNLSFASQLENQWSGIAAISNLQQWNKDKNFSADHLYHTLIDIREYLAQAPVSVLYTGDKSQLAEIRKRVEALPTLTPVTSPLANHPANYANKTAWLLNSDVNYCAQAVHYKITNSPHEVASLHLQASLIETGYLRQAIRHQGGAYGAGARYDQVSNTIKLFSYRDPRLLDTLKDFNNAWQWLESNDAKKYMEQAKLTTLASEERNSINHSTSALHQFFDVLRKRSQDFNNQTTRSIIELDFAILKENLNRLLDSEQRAFAVITDFKNEKLLRESGYEIGNSD